MGLLEGIVVAAFAIGLAMGILLRKCVCRPCGFCGGDDRKVFKASKILKPAPVQKKNAMTTTSVQSIWLLLLDDALWNPIARCTRCKNVRYARIAWEILRRNFIQSKLSTNWSPKKDHGATTGLLCVLQNGSPIFHSFLDTMLTQNAWCWWAGGVPWCHHFVGSNPHGCYHFVGVPIPFCRGIGWAPYRMELSSSQGEFEGGSLIHFNLKLIFCYHFLSPIFILQCVLGLAQFSMSMHVCISGCSCSTATSKQASCPQRGLTRLKQAIWVWSAAYFWQFQDDFATKMMKKMGP